MNKLTPIVIIAVLANLLTVWLYTNAASQPGGSGATMFFIYMEIPLIWLIAVVTTIVFAVRQRSVLFSERILKWTIVTLIFCTPVPIGVLYTLTHPTPETLRSSSSTQTINGKVYISENWYYTSNHEPYLTKYFIADSAAEYQMGEAAYKKDSTWVYLSKTGDTIKIENFKGGKLREK